MIEDRKLYRFKENRVIAGICGGLGEYFNIDPIIFRVLFLVLLVGEGAGLLIYIILWIVIPEEGELSSPKIGREKVANVGKEIQESAQNAASVLKEKTGDENYIRNIIAAVIIAIGVLALLNELFSIRIFRAEFVWPTVIILIVLIIIFKRR